MEVIVMAETGIEGITDVVNRAQRQLTKRLEEPRISAAK
jgi:hypothetical protein